MDRTSPRRIRARARYKVVTPVLAGIVCAPAMMLMTPSGATAATTTTASLGGNTVQASNTNPVGDLLGYVETTVLNALTDVGCGTIPSKAICP